MRQFRKRAASVGEKHSFDLHLICGAIGWVILGLSVALAPSVALDYVDAYPGWIGGAVAMAGLAVVGMTLVLVVGARTPTAMRSHDAIAVIVIIWTIAPLLSSAPFLLSPIGFSFTDAIFESVSGITATGATVMVAIDDLPRGILYWRSVMQLIGGAGVVILAAALLPQLGVGGMQLFRMEFFDRERVLPRFQTIARYFVGIYFGFFILCFGSYLTFGMGWFDAICHAMTTIATGGLSTKAQSFAAFDSIAIESVAIVFMIIGALPFMIYINILISGQFRSGLNRQVLFFLMVWLLCVALALGGRLLYSETEDATKLIIKTMFNVTSFLTTTGYVSEDYQQWGYFVYPLFLMLMLMGGCAGSTTGGLKQFRIIILLQKIKNLVKSTIQQEQIQVVTFNTRPVAPHTTDAVLSYLALFAVTLLAFALLLSLTGLDLTTALSSAVMGITNGGVGLGAIVGPTGSFASLPDSSKWLISLLMLLGRLEILVLLAPLTAGFWKS